MSDSEEPSTQPEPPRLQFEVDGAQVEVADDGASLLEVLRDRLGLRSAKDGCSPQGQCGCCTVLVDGGPRVACVTPARRVVGRSVTTLEGLDRADRDAWADAFCATGASQCGFCTPGIVVRLEGARRKGVDLTDEAAVDRALAAHLCRCTGWRTIHEAAVPAGRPRSGPRPHRRRPSGRAGGRRATAGRARRGDRGRWLRRRPSARRCAGGRPGRGRGLRRGGHPDRGPPGRGQGPGSTHHRGAGAALGPARRRLGPHPAHDVGRARLPGDRRLVVRARWRARIPPGQRRRVRGKGAVGGGGRRPPAGR